MPSNPFQVTKEDVERSSTLTKRDIGKWAYVSNGCINVVGSSLDKAMSIVEMLRGAR